MNFKENIKSNYCRACLQECNEMQSLLNQWEKTLQYCEMMEFLTGVKHIKETDSYPMNICKKCIESLISSYFFKKQCIKSEETIIDILNNEMKLEVELDVIAKFDPLSSEETNSLPNFWDTSATNVDSNINYDLPNDNEEKYQLLAKTKAMPENNDWNELSDESLEKKPYNIYLQIPEELIKHNIKEGKLKCIKRKHRLNLDPNFRHCLRCNLKFPDERAYQVHHREKHRDRNLCPLCGKLVTRQAMDKHIATHTKAKDHLCTECGKRFTLSENLKKHWRIHTGDKRYSCEFCDMKFIHWNSKRSHVRTVHTGEKKYECNICGKKFAQSSNMFRHVRRHTGELPHECSFCHKKFISSPELKNHLVTHTKERNQICNVCNKAFGTKKALRSHLKIHTGEKNYICPVCLKAFTQAHVLRTHMKTHPEFPIPPPGAILSQKALTKQSSSYHNQSPVVNSDPTTNT